MFTKPVLIFCSLTFVISWGIFLIGYALGAFENAIGFRITAFAFMWGPALSALICARIFDKGRMVDVLGITPIFNKWIAVAWGVPIILCLASVGFSVLSPDVHLVPIRDSLEPMFASADKPMPKYIGVLMVVSALTIGAAINGVLLISEELGWRGYLWSKIIGFGFWKTALFTGIIWGFWHAPLIYMGHNYPGMPIAGIFLMVILTTLMSPIIGYIRLRNGSVWAASLFHGTVNAVAALSILPLSVQTFPWNGMVGIGGFAVLAIGCVWVYFAHKKSQLPL